MAETNLTSLKVALVAVVGPFVSGMKQAAGAAEKFGNDLKSGLLGPITAVAGALTTGAFALAVRAAMNRIDDLAKSADRLGISTESFAGLSHAAQLSGSNMEELRGGMEKLTKKVQEAAEGNKAAQATFEHMGTSYKDFVGLAPDAQFKKMADSINVLGTQGEKTKATLDVFGKSGGSLNATIKLGTKGLNEMTEEAKQLGIAVSRVDAAKVENANDALTNVGEVMHGIFDKIAAKLAPFITAIANSFVDAAKASNGFGETIDNVMTFAIDAAGFVANAWQGLKIVWHALLVGVSLLGEGVLRIADQADFVAKWWITKFKQVGEALSATWKAMGAGFSVIWAGLKVAFADFVGFIGRGLAEMLHKFADASTRVAPEMSADLRDAAYSVGRSTGTMAADANINFKKVTTAAAAAGEEQTRTWGAVFSNVTVEHNKTIQDMIAAQDAFQAKHSGEIQNIAAEGPASDKFVPFLQNIQSEEQAKAEQKAREIQAEQEHAQAMAGVASEAANNQSMSWSDFRKKMGADDNKYWKQLSSGTSGMFDNLSKLQNTHSKAAQKIGKAAAKAKIVTDTASAAMGAYSAMASIPFIGPALGIAAAAAAVLAGGIQLANVDKSDGGAIAGGGAEVSASSSVAGAASGPAGNGQTLVLHGDNFSAESMVNLFKEAKERGIVIEGVRRG
jgi:hypothetical protein